MLPANEIVGIIAGAVVLIVSITVAVSLYRGGQRSQRDADATVTADDVTKAQDVEHAVDAMSDDDVDKRLLDEWTRPEHLSRRRSDTPDA